MAANADIFFEHSDWGRPFLWSLLLHVAVTASVALYGWLGPRAGSSDWGSGGGGSAMGVSLVSGVPLPAAQAQTQNVLANESKGLTKSQPKEEVQEQDAIPIADRTTKKKKKTVTATQEKPHPEEEASNVVPFGEGGPVSGPYGGFNAGAAKGGFGFTGGGGDFGSRYGWYVQVVNQKVHQNWLAYEVDPRIKEANRFYLTFDITRDGRPANVQVEQSSGIPVLDQSAVRSSALTSLTTNCCSSSGSE